jgi:hypothetical protein
MRPSLQIHAYEKVCLSVVIPSARWRDRLGRRLTLLHFTKSTTMAAVANTVYDVVNLQGYYAGFSSALAFQTAVQPLYDVAHAAGSEVSLEEMWSYRGDPGSPQFPTAPNAVEAAAQKMPGTHAVQVARVWEDQSKFGEYANALTYARFFSGKSVQGVTFVPPAVRDVTQGGLTAVEIQTLKSAVDAGVTVFYQAPAAARPTLSFSGINLEPAVTPKNLLANPALAWVSADLRH